MVIPHVRLHNGVRIPQLGFGTWQIPPESTRERVLEAIEAGYRHIDTAQMYENEAGVGEAIKESGLPRGDFFITTKLHNSNHGRVEDAFEESRGRLGLESIDLFLIHWPLPTTKFDFVETWRGMEAVFETGRVRAIGVSNFTSEHLQRLLGETSVVPAVNQVEVHPYFVQSELRDFHAAHGIATEAWSPLAQGEVIGDERIGDLAKRLNRTPAQVVLRWALQRGDIVFPKASSPERMAENIDLFDFYLEDEDVALLTSLDEGRRIGPDPNVFDWIGS